MILPIQTSDEMDAWLKKNQVGGDESENDDD
jgi:hypothetical protein